MLFNTSEKSISEIEIDFGNGNGYPHIELDQSYNVLYVDEGIKELHQIIKTRGVGIRSLCAAYYMEEFLVDTDGNARKKAVDHLHWLIDQAAKLSVIYIIIIFFYYNYHN